MELPGGKFSSEQRDEIIDFAERWRRHTTYWQHAPISTRVLRYEDLTARLIPNVCCPSGLRRRRELTEVRSQMMSLLAFLLPDDNLPALDRITYVARSYSVCPFADDRLAVVSSSATRIYKPTAPAAPQTLHNGTSTTRLSDKRSSRSSVVRSAGWVIAALF